MAGRGKEKMFGEKKMKKENHKNMAWKKLHEFTIMF